MLDLIDGNLDYAVFLTSAGIAIFAGLSLALACHRSQPSLGRREVTLAQQQVFEDRRLLEVPGVGRLTNVRF